MFRHYVDIKWLDGDGKWESTALEDGIYTKNPPISSEKKAVVYLDET